MTIDGEEYTDATKAVAGEDKSAEVELVDDYGLQSDGTGIVGDRLTVTYGVDFGTPQNISWYKNGKVVLTNSVGDNVNTGLSITIPAGGNWGIGTYKVTITNKDGEMATTNEIVITDKEEAAKIVDFSIEDNYTDGDFITYNTNDTTAIATVKLAKNYDGTIRIYKKSDGNFATVIDSLRTDVDEPELTSAQIAALGAPAAPAIGAVDNFAILATNMPTNDNISQTAVAGSGIGFIDSDGTVVYKFLINSGVTRGNDYVVTFDQASIATDTPGTGNTNVFAEAVKAPYVTKPASIAVTKVSNGNRPEITFKGEDGATLAWLGTTNAARDTLTDVGFSAAKVYRSTALTNDTSAATVSELAGPSQADEVRAGVWTARGTANNTAYWFATVSTTAGIYGASSETIKSEATTVAQDAATDMDLIQNSDTATTARVNFSNLRAPGTVYIVRGSYQDARATGAANDTIVAGTEFHSSIARIYAKFDKNDTTTYTASAPVAAGTATIDIPNAIGIPTGRSTTSGVNDNGEAEDFNTDDYIAVFIPNDDVNYGMIYTDGAAATTPANIAAATTALAGLSYNSTVGTGAFRSALAVRRVVKTFILNGTTSDLTGGVTYENNSGVYTDTTSANPAAAARAVTGNTLSAKDQFGNEIPGTLTTGYTNVTWRFTKASSEGTAIDGLTLTVDWDGSTGTAGTTPWNAASCASTIVIHDQDSAAATTAKTIAVGDKYTATTANGQTITLEFLGNGAGANVNLTANNTDAAGHWKLTIK